MVQGVSCYWFSIFSILSIIIDRIEGMCRRFLWGTNMGRVAWRQVCLPKEEGGLGLRDLRAWNKALLAKTLWNIHLKKETLWVKWVNEFFLRGSSIWEWVTKADSLPIFKNLVRIRDEMIVKDGQYTIQSCCWLHGVISRVYRSRKCTNGCDHGPPHAPIIVVFGTHCVSLNIPLWSG